jgi:tetratricopeptide (TPR) repeat protein
MENVLQLQGRLARRIARELEATIRPREKRQLSEERTVDSTAYALYLQARALRFQETGAGVVEAVRLLRQSVALDSTFAPPWAVLSTAAWLGPALGGELPPGLRGTSLAREAARRALALDSTSAEAHVAMGIVQQLDGDYPLAGQHFKRALALNPGLANAYLGQSDTAMWLLRQSGYFDGLHYHSVKIDPLLKPLRNEPAFLRELERLGLDDATVRHTMERLAPVFQNGGPKRLRDGETPSDSPLQTGVSFSS